MKSGILTQGLKNHQFTHVILFNFFRCDVSSVNCYFAMVVT